MESIGERWTNPDSLTTPGHAFRCECELCEGLRLQRWREEAQRLQEKIQALSEELLAYSETKPGATGRYLRGLVKHL